MSKHREISKKPLDITFDNLYHAGYFGVDSGSVWIGDRCYMIGLNDEEYSKTSDEYFEKTGYNARQIALGANQSTELMNQYYIESKHKNPPLRQKVEVPKCLMYHQFPNGLLISTLHGDGTYPVYVEMDKDGQKVRRIIIDFDGVTDPFDEDEDFDESDENSTDL